MARILLASNNDDVRGKIGQIIYTKSKSSNTQRKVFLPADKKSSSQITQRNIFKLLSQTWRTIDILEQNSWIEAAKNKVFLNAFGGKYHPSGFNYFMQCNRNNFRLGSSNILTGIINITPHPEVNFINARATAGFPFPQFYLYFDIPFIQQAKVLVRTTPPLAQSLHINKNMYSDLCYFDYSSFGNAIDIYSTYQAKFPMFGPDMQIGVKCYISNSNTDNWIELTQMNSEIIVIVSR
jgi:hypothetical protein